MDEGNYRARLVGREIAWEKRDDLHAATPPLESLKALLSVCASSQGGASPHQIMAADVKREYSLGSQKMTKKEVTTARWPI